ncbi:MAG TPA: hypothetical protein VME69_06195 [Methylocella sp.]|nr:hypothetical protein [Methylocella sp.]
MKTYFQVFLFLLCTSFIVFWEAHASAQSNGANACAILAGKLLPDELETASNPHAALSRHGAHVRNFVGCLQSHGVQPASGPMAEAAVGTYVTFDVPGSVFTNPAAINQVGTIAGYYLKYTPLPGPGNEFHSFARAPGGAITVFDPPGATGGSQALAIDALGTIAGQYCDATTCHGYIRYPSGNIVTFDPPGSLFTTPTAGNSSGMVTGQFCTTPFSVCNGFLRRPRGAIVEFDAPGNIILSCCLGDGYNEMAVNDEGAITGAFSILPESAAGHGFVRTQGGTIATFDPPGSVETFPSDINARGAITGWYEDASDVIHGFLRAPAGAITSFDAPNSIETQACCITSAGTIMGNYFDPGFALHGFLRASNGGFTVFDPQGSVLTIPVAINAWGAIIGFYYDATYEVQHGFLLRPKD